MECLRCGEPLSEAQIAKVVRYGRNFGWCSTGCSNRDHFATSDPNPEQIAAACAEIRRGWTKAERWRRKTQLIE